MVQLSRVEWPHRDAVARAAVAVASWGYWRDLGKQVLTLAGWSVAVWGVFYGGEWILKGLQKARSDE